MEKIYWHHHEFRHELRGIAAHYPKTYIKVGKILKEKVFWIITMITKIKQMMIY